MTKTYTNKDCVRFVKDMEEAGYETEHYRGRFYWEGPAVRTDEENGPTLQDVLSATKVKCQRDNLAFDWIVYPVARDNGE